MITEEQEKLIRELAPTGLGLNEISRRIKTNRGTVAKFCRRKDIYIKHRNHISVDTTTEQLKEWVDSGASTQLIAEYLGIAPATAHQLLKRRGLKTINSVKDHSANYPKCESCGDKRKPYYKSDRIRCPPVCGYCKTKIKEKTVKDQIVKLRGGKCERCGYNECLQALEFHHKEKDNKDEQVSTLIKDSRFNEAYTESLKCELLCSNCHRRHHYKDKWDDKFSEYPEIQEWVKERFTLADTNTPPAEQAA